MAAKKASKGAKSGRGASEAYPPRGVTRARVEKRATAAETARRVDVIVGLMQRDEWRHDVHCPQLAAEWKVSPITVEHIAAEASRRVIFIAQLVANPEKLKADVSGVLVRSLHAAYERGSHADVARVGDIVTRITGARAPERQELKVQMAELEQLPPPALLARLRDQRAKLDEAIAKLLEEHPELAPPRLPKGTGFVCPLHGESEESADRCPVCGPRPGETP